MTNASTITTPDRHRADPIRGHRRPAEPAARHGLPRGRGGLSRGPHGVERHDRPPARARRALCRRRRRDERGGLRARPRPCRCPCKGGGHNIAGNAVCDGGVLIDLGAMNVGPCRSRGAPAWVGPGALLRDVDRETQTFGLVVPDRHQFDDGHRRPDAGRRLRLDSRRKFGMTIDNLVSADVVLADGSLVHASRDEHPDLFWALRGGGGNFGVVTTFEFELHAMGPQVTAGPRRPSVRRCAGVLRAYRDSRRARPTS